MKQNEDLESSEGESEDELKDEDSSSSSSSEEDSVSEQQGDDGDEDGDDDGEEEEEKANEEENEDGPRTNASSSSESSDTDSSASSSETIGPALPVFSSDFPSGQHEAAEPLTGLVGSFKVTDPDMGLAPSFGNLSPGFDSKGSLAEDHNLVVDQDINPVVDFPDTDSTALIKELSAEVFSIEAPENSTLDPQQLSDDEVGTVG